VSDAEAADFEILETETLLEGRPFNVLRHRLRLPNGRESTYQVAQHPGAVALVALDGEGRWLLVRQYRVPTGREMLEVPAGTREPGEAPEMTAARELREETGYAADRLERIGGTWMAPGFVTEYIHYYLATSLRHDPLEGDDDEFLSPPVAMSFDEVLGALDSGAIEDAKTVVATALYQRWLAAQGRRSG
jgi:ADP-ribose pyrophosphatase